MNEIDAPDDVTVISAEPGRIRVSVFGGRTQLDIGLPLDLPVSSFIPDLARLIRSRDASADEDPRRKEERRTFWVLSRFDDGTEIEPNKSLREAGVIDGELLRLTSDRALSPPTLYDDVVDAAAQLNKAAYAQWDARSARWMAFLGANLGAIAFALLLLQPLSTPQRAVLTGLGVVLVVGLTTFAAIAHRNFALDDVATALGAATIPISAASIGAPLAQLGEYGVAGTSLALIIVNFSCYRIIGAGRWAFLASSLAAGLGGVAVLTHALGVRVDVVCVVLAITTALLCMVVPRFTARLDHFETPVSAAQREHTDDWPLDDPFATGETPTPTETDPGASMPTAEDVRARVRAAVSTRSALLSGFAGTAAGAGTVLLRDGESVAWSEFAFALVVAAVLGLRNRYARPWAERFALALPAIALVIITCAVSQMSAHPMPLAAVGVLLSVAVGAVLLGLTTRDTPDLTSRRARTAAYLDYLAVGALIPVGLWTLGAYEHLGPWW